MPYKDKEKQREAVNRAHRRAWKEKRGPAYLRKQRLIGIVNAAKDRPCADCGQSYPPYVMDFDHVRGEKIANVATLVSMSASVTKLEDEIAKCDVVCANCHRERTYGSG